MILTATEQVRLVVLNRVLVGDLTAAEAAAALGLSVRQVRRILAAYRKEGAAALAHGNRGRTPVHALDLALGRRIVELAQTKYAGVNDTHLSELLAADEGIALSRSSVRRLRLAAGLERPRSRRPPAHRRRRERKAQAGMLLQLDASPHAWLEERGPRLVLVAAIDDATGTVPAAVFREQEDTAGYLEILHQVVTTVGVPAAVYHDRHGIFIRAPQEKERLDEQLAGTREPTQVGRALRELGIASIGGPLAAGQGAHRAALWNVAGSVGRRAAPGGSHDAGGGQCAPGGLLAPLQRALRRTRSGAGTGLPCPASAHRPLAGLLFSLGAHGGTR